MARNSATVALRPFCQSMKTSRKVAANTERQNTTVQLSLTVKYRAMAPPKLQAVADPKTSHAPRTSSERVPMGYSAPRRWINSIL